TTPSPASMVPSGGILPRNSQYADDADVGAMAKVLLRAAPARRLVIEVDYVSGRRPSQQALDHLKAILQRELAKPDGVVINVDNEITNPRGSYTLNNLLGLERQYRRLHSNGEAATIWIAALNGTYAGGS